jgi:hypothetical protein
MGTGMFIKPKVRGGLISLWLYKEDNKLPDWKKKCVYSTCSPLRSTHLWLRCSKFFNPSKNNSCGCAANRKIGKAKDLSAPLRTSPYVRISGYLINGNFLPDLQMRCISVVLSWAFLFQTRCFIFNRHTAIGLTIGDDVPRWAKFLIIASYLDLSIYSSKSLTIISLFYMIIYLLTFYI